MKSIFITTFYFVAANSLFASDTVLWRQEFTCDSNSTCKPVSMLVDDKNNELILFGMSSSSGTKESVLLLKVDSNGNVLHRRSLGLLSKYGTFKASLFGIKTTIEPDTGDIVRLNIYDVNSISLAVTDKNMQTQTNSVNFGRKPSETILLHDMISCSNGSIILVGQHSKDGIIMKLNLDGNIVWEKIFNINQINILSSAVCAFDRNNFYVAGMSASMVGKMMLAEPATISVLSYDGNGELQTEDSFEGGLAPWPSSLPKIIRLSSGIVLVVYDKSKNGKATELYARAYNPDLSLLWEKQLLQTKEDGPPASFDICATSNDRFALACVVDYWDLRIFEYEADGTILQTLDLNREVGPGRVYVNYLVGEIIVASATKLKENEKEAKIKVLAIKPHEIN